MFHSKLFTCPFHSLHFSFGFQRLPSRLSWPIDLLGPSFHSLPSYDLLRSCALPSVIRCSEITLHFMVFYGKLFTCPFHSLHFSLGFKVYLPCILGLLICLVLAFTRHLKLSHKHTQAHHENRMGQVVICASPWYRLADNLGAGATYYKQLCTPQRL